MASVVLGEEFYLGGVIGAVLIVVGLYLVVWGVKRASLLEKIWQFPQSLGTIRENLPANLLSSNHYLVVSVKTVIASKSHYNLPPKAVPVPRQHFQLLRPNMSP
nr:auxin-induced protein 5ng4 [Quercus suber]